MDRHRDSLSILACLVGLLLLAMPVVCFADGDSPDRPATAQERAAYTTAHAAAVAAVPPPPQNQLWRTSIPCLGSERYV
jgi:hypothetical protein